MSNRQSSSEGKFGGRAFRYASSGRMSRFESLVESWTNAARSMGIDDPSKADMVVRQELILLRDRKERSLLHVAAKSGQTSMIHYFMKLGLPPQGTDVEGNSVAHCLLKYYLKSRSSKKSKRSRQISPPGSLAHTSCYTDCCRLLSVLLRGQPVALTTQNDDGQSPTDMLQQLWHSAAADDRAIGDEILMNFMSPSDHVQTGLEHSSHGFDAFNSSPGDWSPGTDWIQDTCSWEDYFSDFGDQDRRSYLDTIAEEYARRRRTTYTQRPSKQTTYQASPSPSTSADFHRRHENAMLQRSQLQKAERTNSLTLDEFRNQWAEFVSRDTKICQLSDVVWPPVCDKVASVESRVSAAELRIQMVVTFVRRSVSTLRQFQVDWHPDRFLARFGDRVEDESVKQAIMQRVNALSQLFNTSMDALRKDNDDNKSETTKCS